MRPPAGSSRRWAATCSFSCRSSASASNSSLRADLEDGVLPCHLAPAADDDVAIGSVEFNSAAATSVHSVTRVTAGAEACAIVVNNVYWEIGRRRNRGLEKARIPERPE